MNGRQHAPKLNHDGVRRRPLDFGGILIYIVSRPIMAPLSDISLREFQALAQLRYVIRKFLVFSADAARSCDIKPQQHQLLLALKGLPPKLRPTISSVAERLQLQHHSTVELVNRLTTRGLLQRTGAKEDHREVLLRITPLGERLLKKLSLAHRRELRSAAPELIDALTDIMGTRKRNATNRKPARAVAQRNAQ